MICPCDDSGGPTIETASGFAQEGTPAGAPPAPSAAASAGQTLAALAGSWASADLTERAELVRLLLLPEGLRYDLMRQQLVAVRSRASFLVPLRLVWQDWRAQTDGWLVRDAEPAAVTLHARGAGGAHSNA